MNEMLAVIDAPHYYAGIVLRDDVVIAAADIVRWMAEKRWTRTHVREYCRAKGYKASVVSVTTYPVDKQQST